MKGFIILWDSSGGTHRFEVLLEPFGTDLVNMNEINFAPTKNVSLTHKGFAWTEFGEPIFKNDFQMNVHGALKDTLTIPRGGYVLECTQASQVEVE